MLTAKRDAAQHGSFAQARSDWGCTPLWTATWDGQVDVMRVLIGHGADVNAATTVSCSIYSYFARWQLGVSRPAGHSVHSVWAIRWFTPCWHCAGSLRVGNMLVHSSDCWFTPLSAGSFIESHKNEPTSRGPILVGRLCCQRPLPLGCRTFLRPLT
jgi:hypothetical protein